MAPLALASAICACHGHEAAPGEGNHQIVCHCFYVAPTALVQLIASAEIEEGRTLTAGLFDHEPDNSSPGLVSGAIVSSMDPN